VLRQVAKIERPAGVGVPDTVRGESHKKGKNRYEGNWKCAKSFACNPHDVFVESCRLFDGASRVTSHVCECGLTPPVLYGISSVEGSGGFIWGDFVVSRRELLERTSAFGEVYTDPAFLASIGQQQQASDSNKGWAPQGDTALLTTMEPIGEAAPALPGEIGSVDTAIGGRGSAVRYDCIAATWRS